MKTPLLSIIIPLYNNANYVVRCLSTILDQDFILFEVIIVNDGSTDHSVDIISNQFQDKRISLVHTPHKGVSAARNTGILVAKGTFLLFIDADDYITPHYFNRIVEESINNEADIYIWGLTKDYIDGHQEKFIPTKLGLVQRDVFLHEMVQEQYRRHIGLMGYIPNKLIRRTIVINENIKFNTQMTIQEDFDFYLSYYKHVHTAFFFNETGYHYVEYPKMEKSTNKDVDYISLIDTHRRCLILSKDSSENSNDYLLVLKNIGQLTFAMFLEMYPISIIHIRSLLYKLQKRPWAYMGLHTIRPKHKLLRKFIIGKREYLILLYLKGRKYYHFLKSYLPFQ